MMRGLTCASLRGKTLCIWSESVNPLLEWKTVGGLGGLGGLHDSKQVSRILLAVLAVLAALTEGVNHSHPKGPRARRYFRSTAELQERLQYLEPLLIPLHLRQRNDERLQGAMSAFHEQLQRS
jgi:hypothetical protein